jgi:hypothetical protein
MAEPEPCGTVGATFRHTCDSLDYHSLNAILSFTAKEKLPGLT